MEMSGLFVALSHHLYETFGDFLNRILEIVIF